MIDRRSLIGFMAAAASLGWKARACAADRSDKGLFWRLQIPDKGTAVVFGAWMIAASVVPGIVLDAYAFIELTRRMIGGYPDYQFKFNGDRKDDKPLVEILSPRLANEVRVITEASPGLFRGQFEEIPAFMTPLLLIGEGQTQMPPAVPVGTMIRAYAEQVRRPVSFLLSESEVRGLLGIPDLAMANDAANETLITYLIELRRQRGPLGRYVEQLYAARDGERLQSLCDDLFQHGLPPMGWFSKSAILQVRTLILQRLLEAVGSQSGISFFVLELPMLTGTDGLLAALRRQGATISVLT
jgi:hypothetical protein